MWPAAVSALFTGYSDGLPACLGVSGEYLNNNFSFAELLFDCLLFIVVVRLRYASPTYEPLGVIRCVINYFFQISGNQNWSLFIYFNMRPFICCCTINVDK